MWSNFLDRNQGRPKCLTLLIFLVMCKNLLFTLRASGLVFVPSSVVPSFVVYCRLKGVFPSGGAIEPDGQYFYL